MICYRQAAGMRAAAASTWQSGGTSVNSDSHMPRGQVCKAQAQAAAQSSSSSSISEKDWMSLSPAPAARSEVTKELLDPHALLPRLVPIVHAAEGAQLVNG